MIKYIICKINSFSQSLSWFLGLTAIIFFVYMFISGDDPKSLMKWSFSTLGTLFIFILSSQILLSIFCIVQLNSSKIIFKRYWFEFGVQVSNSISTIALTFTLFGISVGIGGISSSNLDILTINQTIGNLTKSFSMAFMTSVIGLPVSAIFKSILVIMFEYFLTKHNFLNHKQIEGEKNEIFNF